MEVLELMLFPENLLENEENDLNVIESTEEIENAFEKYKLRLFRNFRSPRDDLIDQGQIERFTTSVFYFKFQ